jgi:hypothetical protein
MLFWTQDGTDRFDSADSAHAAHGEFSRARKGVMLQKVHRFQYFRVRCGRLLTCAYSSHFKEV